MSQRVFVAMSGGVDSAAAALLLRQAGYNVTGVTLRLHPYKDRPGLCGSADDIETARAVAAGMGIPHVVLDLCDLFRERVMDRFVWAYTHGRTPNPCIDCNRLMKFDKLLENQHVLAEPVVRNGKQATVGYAPDVWKTWE